MTDEMMMPAEKTKSKLLDLLSACNVAAHVTRVEVKPDSEFVYFHLAPKETGECSC